MKQNINDPLTNVLRHHDDHLYNIIIIYMSMNNW